MADGTFGLDSVVDSRAKQTMVWRSPDAYASDAPNRPSARPPQTAGAQRAGASFPMTQRSLSVVGIGASAGGIEAFRRFFERVPVDSGLAFIIVLHLPDIGRPLSDIVSWLTYTTLREDVQAVPQTLQPMERRVDRQDGSAH